MIAISIWLPAAATIALYTPMLLLEVRYLLHGLSAALLLIAFTVGAVVPPRTVWSAAGLQASHHRNDPERRTVVVDLLAPRHRIL